MKPDDPYEAEAWDRGYEAGVQAVRKAVAAVLNDLPIPLPAATCCVICMCGPNGEPLACGYRANHVGPHSWATLPTFTSDRQTKAPTYGSRLGAWFHRSPRQ